MIGNQLTPAFTLLAIVALATGKLPPPPGAPWAKFAAKPVFERSLGPPPMSGVGTFSIPYIPKPSMFPKFVDPRIMIAKKTDLLSNLFGGLGPAMGPVSGFGSPSPYTGYGSTAYTYPAGMYGPDDLVRGSGSDEAGDDANSPIFYAPGLDPKPKYLESFGAPSTGSIGLETASSSLKRGLFGPMGSKSSFGGSFGPKTPMTGPFYGGSGFSDDTGPGSPSFSRRGLIGPKVTPFSDTANSLVLKPTKTYLDALFKNGESSTDKTEPEGTGVTQGPPPSYPNIPVIPEETVEAVENEKKESAPLKTGKDLTKRMVADDSVPKEYLPGMYGPMGPAFGPPGSIFGPDAFMSKKSMFLDTLFKSLATTTVPTITDSPVTAKSTIVPPGFWLPESVIPDPGAYNAKVATFLDKLFDSLKLNASGTGGDTPLQSLTYEESISAGFPGGKLDTARSLPPDYSGSSYSPYFKGAPAKSARSLADPEAVITAKDQIVNSIIGELGILKDDMMSTFNELIAYQKNISTGSAGSKPFKPFPPPFWAAASTASDLGTLPYKRRMIILDQVFDMLTELQTNVSLAVNDAVKSSYAEELPEPEVQIATTTKPDLGTLNISVLDAIQAKINDLNTVGLTKVSPTGFPAKFSRALPVAPTSFWVAYPGGESARRNLIDQENTRSGEQDVVDETGDGNEGVFNTGKDPRAIKMQMHQGYQSLPPGTIESVQAGGGSVPGHEGGGVKLLGANDYEGYQKWQDWSKTMEQAYQNNHRHHHGRH